MSERQVFDCRSGPREGAEAGGNIRVALTSVLATGHFWLGPEK